MPVFTYAHNHTCRNPHRPQTHWPCTQSQYYMMSTMGTHGDECDRPEVHKGTPDTVSSTYTQSTHIQFIPEDITVSACTYVHSVTAYRIQAPRAKLLTQQHLQLVEDHIYAIVRWNLPTTNLDANTLCMNGLRHRQSNSHHAPHTSTVLLQLHISVSTLKSNL